jgi:hypothetical protein
LYSLTRPPYALVSSPASALIEGISRRCRVPSGPFVSDDIECFRHLALEPWNGAGYPVVARSLPQTRYTLLNIRAPPLERCRHVLYALKARMCVVRMTMKLLEFLDDFGFSEIIRWRRGRDSNPRYPCEYAAFRVRCFQPLSHLSEAA